MLIWYFLQCSIANNSFIFSLSLFYYALSSSCPNIMALTHLYLFHLNQPFFTFTSLLLHLPVISASKNQKSASTLPDKILFATTAGSYFFTPPHAYQTHYLHHRVRSYLPIVQKHAHSSSNALSSISSFSLNRSNADGCSTNGLLTVLSWLFPSSSYLHQLFKSQHLHVFRLTALMFLIIELFRPCRPWLHSNHRSCFCPHTPAPLSTVT